MKNLYGKEPALEKTLKTEITRLQHKYGDAP